MVALSDRPATVASDRYDVRRAIPAEWRERLVEAYDQEFRE